MRLTGNMHALLSWTQNALLVNSASVTFKHVAKEDLSSKLLFYKALGG